MRTFAFLLGIFILSGSGLMELYAQEYTPEFHLSEDPVVKVPDGQDYVFGYLEVPEVRSDPDSRTIQLPVYIFKSRSDQPKKDPVIYTVGGPGSTSMRAAAYMQYYQYLNDRDLILFEQRGTQYARPHLNCPEWSEAVSKSSFPDISSEEETEMLTEAASACKKRLGGNNINLEGYRTTEIAADMEDLRKVLDIEQWNLLTISYSTKIAQVMMREYPESIRSVVMDSALPLASAYDEESIANLISAYDKLFDDCEISTRCSEAFPELRERFYGLLERISDQPIQVKTEHPQMGNTLTYDLKGKDIFPILALYSTGDIPELPAQIEKIINGEKDMLRSYLQSSLSGPGDGSGMGMRLSVWCAEEFPFASEDIIEKESQKYSFAEGLSPAVFDPEVCKTWNVKPAGKLENQPMESEIPVLFINGEYDNETPPEWAAEMMKFLPNSYHLIFEGWHHTPTTNWGNQCAMSVANAFFNDPSKKPVSDCFEAITAPDFTVNE